ncbi:MAG: pilus assembly protein [Firmicutes bacterium]|nr:pilus assembly protein [Bacillota bacterium]
MYRLFSAFKNEKGQSVVEFALFLPLILLLILGTVQCGILFYGQIVITGAAREGARLASVGKTKAAIVTKVNERIEAAPFLSVDSDRPLTVTPLPGQAITVTVPANLDIIFPFLGRQGTGVYPLCASCSMRGQEGHF